MRHVQRRIVMSSIVLLAACVLLCSALVSAQEPDLPTLMFLSLRFENGTTNIELDRLNVQSKRILRLMPIEHQYYAQGPQWSPDGQFITFTANRPDVDAPDLWIMDASGGHARMLVEESRAHSWAPDSQHIAYEGLTDEGIPAVYTMAIDGSDAHLLIENGDLPVWSPDGRLIAYRDDNDVVSIISPDGTAPKHLFERTEEMIGTLEWLSWSPDGAHIAFLISTDRPEDNMPTSTLYTITPQGTELIHLTNVIHNPGTYYQWKPYDWSPDSQRIALVSNWYDAGLYTIKADGTRMQRIVTGVYENTAPGDFGAFQSLDWSPDGSMIAFSATRYQGIKLWMVRPDGSDVRHLTQRDSKTVDVFPEWRPVEP